MVAERQVLEKGAIPRPRVAPDRAASAVAAPPPPRRSMAHTGPPVVRRAKAIQENSRVPGAVLLATFTVTILCLYLSAYASVTADGFDLSRLRQMNKEAGLQRDVLQAEISRLSLPRTVAQRAAALQMEPGTPETLTIVSNVPGRSSSAMPPETPAR